MRDRQAITATHNINFDDEDILEDIEENGLSIRVGNTATIMIKENASTGYQWMVDSAQCVSLLSLESRIGHPKRDPSFDNVMYDENGIEGGRQQKMTLGAPAIKYITISALAPGKCSFDMVLAREW